MLDAALPVPCVVLVVDDDALIREAVGQQLRDSGFDVIEARDGVEAIEIMRTFRPDAILTDLNMPRCDGEGLCRHVRCEEATAGIPVVLLTGAPIADAGLCDSGFTAVVHKPAPSTLPNLIGTVVIAANGSAPATTSPRPSLSPP